MSTIFVQIAAYNDDELPKTVNDCINKSSGNHKIFFGIHECYIENKTIFNIDNIKIKYSKAPENLGVGIARYLANQLYNNEDYYLQVDCHTRFKQNWDELLINNLEKHLQIGNKCILTAYPPSYWYENEKEMFDTHSPSLVIKLKTKNQEELFRSKRIIDQEGVFNDYSFCADSVSAGFIFGTGDISKVKQHPGIFYFGEEFHRAATFYTYGYNLMAPDVPVVFHLYGNHAKRVPPWANYPEQSAEGVKMSDSIIKRMLSSYSYEDPEVNIWMGKERSLEMFGRYLGIDFKNGIIYKEVIK